MHIGKTFLDSGNETSGYQNDNQQSKQGKYKSGNGKSSRNPEYTYE